MKLCHLFYSVIFILQIIGCGSRIPVNKMPAHLSYGSKQMEKGLGWYQKGCYRRAKSFFLKAHERFSALDQQQGVAMSLNNLANVHRLSGEIPQAHHFYDKAIEIFKQLEDKPSQVRVLTNKAAAFISLNQFSDANKILDRAYTISLKHHINPIWIYNHKGILYTRSKRYEMAKSYLTKALSHLNTEEISQIANVHFAMGNLLMENNQPKEAIPYFEKALFSDQKQGYYKGIGDDLKFIGMAHFKLGHWQRAFNYFERSIKVFAMMGKKNEVVNLLKQIELIKEKENLSLDVTAIFVHRWLNENPIEPLCPD